MTSKRKASSGSEPETPDDSAAPVEPSPEAQPVPESRTPAGVQSPPEPTALEVALRASVPDLVVADADLELGGGAVIDLACIDGAGRGVFVRAVDGDSDATVLEALDLVRGIRENQDVLYRHLGLPGLNDAMPPLAVLVADRFSDEVLARLTCIEAGALWCLERRSIRSRAATSQYLVPVLAEAAPEAKQPADPTEFCQHLAPEHRDLGLDLVGRLARIDDELEHVDVDRGVSWKLAGEPVCSVFARDGRLEGTVAPRTTPDGIDSLDRIETFVEEALSRAVELLGPPLGDDSGEAMMRSAALDPNQPILTPEEIQAFHDL